MYQIYHWIYRWWVRYIIGFIYIYNHIIIYIHIYIYIVCIINPLMMVFFGGGWGSSHLPPSRCRSLRVIGRARRSLNFWATFPALWKHLDFGLRETSGNLSSSSWVFMDLNGVQSMWRIESSDISLLSPSLTHPICTTCAAANCRSPAAMSGCLI